MRDTKNNMRIKKMMYVIIPLCAICYYLIFTPCGSSLFKKRFYKKEISGVIGTRYINVNNHNIKTIKIYDHNVKHHKMKKITTPYCNKEIYSIVEIGDTITKDKNTNTLNITGIDLDTIFTYDLQ